MKHLAANRLLKWLKRNTKDRKMSLEGNSDDHCISFPLKLFRHIICSGIILVFHETTILIRCNVSILHENLQFFELPSLRLSVDCSDQGCNLQTDVFDFHRFFVRCV